MDAYPASKLVRTPDAAAFLSISVSTLNKMRIYGGGPKYLKLGRSVAYDPADLDKWAKSRRRSSTSAA